METSNGMNIKIRQAKKTDFESLYAIGESLNSSTTRA